MLEASTDEMDLKSCEANPFCVPETFNIIFLRKVKTRISFTQTIPGVSTRYSYSLDSSSK